MDLLYQRRFGKYFQNGLTPRLLSLTINITLRPRLLSLTINITVTLTMAVENQEPDQGKHKPREVEGGGKAKQSPRPGKVYHRGEEVLQVPEKY